MVSRVNSSRPPRDFDQPRTGAGRSLRHPTDLLAPRISLTNHLSPCFSTVRRYACVSFPAIVVELAARPAEDVWTDGTLQTTSAVISRMAPPGGTVTSRSCTNSKV